ncbi:unnamed protein product [Trifolium pratense]|uniref:Uncharacterized protein n=1 Tax=Trifolium pratense TaxID=57577 RepID=A0ACB0LQ34_TRIPR|nr:unnamed protein product [Trifolium pratense]
MGTNCSYFVDVSQHFFAFGNLATGNINKRLHHIIWLATTWSIWRTRNNILFRGACIDIDSLTEKIIYFSWYWFIGRLGNNANLVFSN